MAMIELEMINLVDPATGLLEDPNILVTWLDGLNITFDPTAFEDGVNWTVIFIGPYDDLVTLIARYEEDEELRSDIIDDIEE